MARIYKITFNCLCFIFILCVSWEEIEWQYFNFSKVRVVVSHVVKTATVASLKVYCISPQVCEKNIPEE